MVANTNIVTLDELARRVRISRRWLHKEAVAGRLPCLKAGQRRLFNVYAVIEALAARAAQRGRDPTD